jgi:hypothetical protein
MAKLAAGAAILLLVSCGGNDALVNPGAGSAGAPADGGVALDGGVSTNGLTGISLSQTDVHIPVGVMTAFAVTGTYADGTKADFSQQAQVSSSNPTVATVQHGQGAQIQIYAMNPGTATITVIVDRFTQTCAVTVTPR